MKIERYTPKAYATSEDAMDAAEAAKESTAMPMTAGRTLEISNANANIYNDTSEFVALQNEIEKGVTPHLLGNKDDRSGVEQRDGASEYSDKLERYAQPGTPASRGSEGIKGHGGYWVD